MSSHAAVCFSSISTAPRNTFKPSRGSPTKNLKSCISGRPATGCQLAPPPSTMSSGAPRFSLPTRKGSSAQLNGLSIGETIPGSRRFLQEKSSRPSLRACRLARGWEHSRRHRRGYPQHPAQGNLRSSCRATTTYKEGCPARKGEEEEKLKTRAFGPCRAMQQGAGWTSVQGPCRLGCHGPTDARGGFGLARDRRMHVSSADSRLKVSGQDYCICAPFFFFFFASGAKQAFLSWGGGGRQLSGIAFSLTRHLPGKP